MIWEKIERIGEETPDKMAMIVDKRTFTYGQLVEYAGDVARREHFRAHECYPFWGDFPEAQLIYFLAALSAKARPVITHPLMEAMDRLKWIRRLDDLYDSGSIPEKADFGVVTSGTTGLPKVWWRRDKSWASYFPVQNEIFKFDKYSRLFYHGSLSFTGDMNAVLAALYQGGMVITSMSKRPADWARLCEKEGATHLYMVPSKLRLFLKGVKNPEQMKSLQVLFCGSQQWSESLMEEMEEKLPKDLLCFLYYGATELNFITYCTKEDWRLNHDTVGKPFPGVKVSIGEDNLIYVDTPYGIEGIPRPYAIGDHGHFSDDGDLIFEGRMKDRINYGGLKLSISAMERKLLTVPGIEEAAVVGVPDEKRGEKPIAFLVINDHASWQDVLHKIHHEIPVTEQAKKFYRVNEMPLNDSSKIDKKMLLKTVITA